LVIAAALAEERQYMVSFAGRIGRSAPDVVVISLCAMVQVEALCD
jgi:hypothetical protein